jgi:DNA (cytosine-5)-methyltransferase 1
MDFASETLIAVADLNQVTSKSNRSQPTPGLSHTLPAKANAPIAFTMKDYGADAGDLSPTLRSGSHDKSHANGGVMPAVAVQEAQTGVREYDTAGSLRANGPGHDPVGTRVRSASGVRRLMPIECERLQGFPDNYTLIPYRGKLAADGPRYKAIGNSMAVPVIRWILQRIEAVDRLDREGAA